jgi:hypothetical protein
MVTKILNAVLDTDNNILIGLGWQEYQPNYAGD